MDYIVAESLAQRRPQLKSQVAALHSQFRHRINICNAYGCPTAGACTIRYVLSCRKPSDNVDACADGTPATDNDEDALPNA